MNKIFAIIGAVVGVALILAATTVYTQPVQGWLPISSRVVLDSSINGGHGHTGGQTPSGDNGRIVFGQK